MNNNEIKASEFDILQNLLQHNYLNVYFDFHNNYDCIEISLKEDMLTLIFKECLTLDIVKMTFLEVKITFFKMNHQNSIGIPDLLYRGRYMMGNELIEYSENKGYFYLDFEEGVQLEFWSNRMLFEKN